MMSKINGKFPVVEYALSTLEANENTELPPDVYEKCFQLLIQQLQEKITFDQCSNMLMQMIGSNYPCKLISQVSHILAHHLPQRGMNVSSHGTRKCRMWTKDEDIVLLAGIQKYGLGDWKSISQYVGNGRTRSQCAQRWGRALNPFIVKDPWTEEEDSILLKEVQELGEHAWATISKKIKTRSDVQCRYRYYKIVKHQPMANIRNAPFNYNIPQQKFVANDMVHFKTEPYFKQFVDGHNEIVKENPLYQNQIVVPVKNTDSANPISGNSLVEQLFQVNLFSVPADTLLAPLKEKQ